MKRYRQPQTGTNVTKKQIDFENTPVYIKTRNMLDALQHIYKGELKHEWQ